MLRVYQEEFREIKYRIIIIIISFISSLLISLLYNEEIIYITFTTILPEGTLELGEQSILTTYITERLETMIKQSIIIGIICMLLTGIWQIKKYWISAQYKSSKLIWDRKLKEISICIIVGIYLGNKYILPWLLESQHLTYNELLSLDLWIKLADYSQEFFKYMLLWCILGLLPLIIKSIIEWIPGMSRIRIILLIVILGGLIMPADIASTLLFVSISLIITECILFVKILNKKLWLKRKY